MGCVELRGVFRAFRRVQHAKSVSNRHTQILGEPDIPLGLSRIACSRRAHTLTHLSLKSMKPDHRSGFTSHLERSP